MEKKEWKTKLNNDSMTEFKEYAAEKLLYIKALEDMGYTTDQAINIMLYICIDEISDVLGTTEYGDIAENLGKLACCIGYVPPNSCQKEGYNLLRIGGSVDTE